MDQDGHDFHALFQYMIYTWVQKHMFRILILDISSKDYGPIELKLDEEHRGA